MQPSHESVLVECIQGLLKAYASSEPSITMMVGQHATVTLMFTGGPITKETIEDTLAHLAFYKKYFPKDCDVAPIIQPDKLVEIFKENWAEHRRLIDQKTQPQPPVT